MKSKSWILASTVIFLFGFLCAETPQENRKPGAKKIMEQTSLVRKDLLETTKKQLSPPLRNIFTRHRISSRGEEPGLLGAEGEPSQSSPFIQSGSKNENTEMPINVKYIGYVNSEKRVIALILLDGETYAVETGDMLEGGISVGEITPDDVEIIGPDSDSIKVKLEGEKP
jgi:hypothetical protein